jgi:hypothetical protein
VGKDELDTVGFEKIVKPVPAGGTFNDSLVRRGERSEIRQNDLRAIA